MLVKVLTYLLHVSVCSNKDFRVAFFTTKYKCWKFVMRRVLRSDYFIMTYYDLIMIFFSNGEMSTCSGILKTMMVFQASEFKLIRSGHQTSCCITRE